MFLPIGVEPRPQRTPVVTSALILINVAVFLLFSLGSPDSSGAIRWAMVPSDLYWPTLFTNLFLHAGWIHLLGNMLFLWIFGRSVEDRLGHLGFAVFYIVGGLAADAAHLLSNPTSDVPTLGASGAISGVMGAFAVFHPRQIVKTLIVYWIVTVIRTPAALWIGLWFAAQVFLDFLTRGASGVAYFAHIGGFIAGGLIAGMIRVAGHALPAAASASAAPPGPDETGRRSFLPVPEEPDIEWMDESGDSYSVVRLEEDPAVLGAIGTVVESVTGESASDVVRRLERTRGLIARQVSLEAAGAIQRELHRLGIPSAKILHSRANLPPPPQPAEAVSWDDRHLRIRFRDQIAQVPWGAPFLWVAARCEGRTLIDVFLNRRTAFRVEDGRTAPLTEVDPESRSELSRDLSSFARAARSRAGEGVLSEGMALLAEGAPWGRLDFPGTVDYDDYVFRLYNLILARSSRTGG